jgi:hypothetical protein
MKRKKPSASESELGRRGSKSLHLSNLPVVLTSCILEYLAPRELVRVQSVASFFLLIGRQNYLWKIHCETIWPCVSSSPIFSSVLTLGNSPVPYSAQSFFSRLQAIDVPAPTPYRGHMEGTNGRALANDVRTVVLFVKFEQDGLLVHSSVCTLVSVMEQRFVDQFGDGIFPAKLEFHFTLSHLSSFRTTRTPRVVSLP